MRHVRLGSYSIAATLAVTPSLLRLKSMMRYCCLCPPPRWRDVLRPWAWRPADFGLGPSSDFSGRFAVISAKSETVWKRRPGLVGLRVRMPMTTSVLEQRDLARGERDDGVLDVGLGADPVGAPRAAALARAVQRVDAVHLDAPDQLDGVADLRLARRRMNLEGVDPGLHQRVALFGDDRGEDDVARILHDASPCSLEDSLASVSSLTLPSAVVASSALRSGAEAVTAGDSSVSAG